MSISSAGSSLLFILTAAICLADETEHLLVTQPQSVFVYLKNGDKREVGKLKVGDEVQAIKHQRYPTSHFLQIEVQGQPNLKGWIEFRGLSPIDDAANHSPEKTTDPIADSQNTAPISAGTQLIQATYRDGENTIISPYSLWTALKILQQGARGETREELTQLVGTNDSVKALRTYQADSPVGFRSDSRLWKKERAQLDEDFAQFLKGIGISSVDTDFSERDRQAANDWIAAASGDLLQDSLTPAIWNQEAELIVSNVVSFHAPWQIPFEEKLFNDFEFTLGNGKFVSTSMMRKQSKFDYAISQQLESRAIRLKYADSNFSAIIILPDNVDGLQQLIDKLDAATLDQLLSDFQPQLVSLLVPLMELQSRANIKESLRSLGIRNLFTDEADLTGLLTGGRFKVSEIQQDSVLKVDQAGTKFGASTNIGVVPVGVDPQTIRFSVDHPFLMMIIDDRTRAIVMSATIQNPKS